MAAYETVKIITDPSVVEANATIIDSTQNIVRTISHDDLVTVTTLSNMSQAVEIRNAETIPEVTIEDVDPDTTTTRSKETPRMVSILRHVELEPDTNDNVTMVSEISQLFDGAIPRERGRPTKPKLPTTPENASNAKTTKVSGSIPSVKRKRGRPAKQNIVVIRKSDNVRAPHSNGTQVKRGRGRPRKSDAFVRHGSQVLRSSPGPIPSSTTPRLSSRLATKRESGYVAPWKALMKHENSVEDDSDNDEDFSMEEDEDTGGEEEQKKPPTTPAATMKRGRGRPPKVRRTTKEQPNNDQDKDKEMVDPLDVRQTLEQIITTDTTQQRQQQQQQDAAPEPEETKVFSNAAVCISPKTVDYLITHQLLDMVLGQLSVALTLTWSMVGESTHFLHGDLSALLQAQQVLAMICQGQSAEEAFSNNGLPVVTIIQTTDEPIDTQGTIVPTDTAMEITNQDVPIQDTESNEERAIVSPRHLDEEGKAQGKTELEQTYITNAKVDQKHVNHQDVKQHIENPTKENHPTELSHGPSIEIKDNTVGGTRVIEVLQVKGDSITQEEDETQVEALEEDDTLEDEEGETQLDVKVEEPQVDPSAEEHPAMYNPTTGERYNRSCAVYTNPDMATVSCNICDFVTTEKGLLKHKMRKHPELVFECEICMEKFGVRYDMRRHRIKHFNDKGELKANFEQSFRSRFPSFVGRITLGVVEAQFSPPKDIEPENEKQESKESTETTSATRLPSVKSLKKVLMCDECDYHGAPASVNKHKLISHPKFLYKCPKCPFELGELLDFLRHFTEHNETAEEVTQINIEDLGEFCECTSCGHFGTEEDLQNHVKTQHLPKLRCRRCDVSFPNQRGLQQHFRTEHRDLYIIPNKSKKNDLKLPRDTSRCSCEICGQEVRLSWYHQHMKTHNRITLRCHFCGFETWKRFAMKNHLLTKHGPKQFMCDVCGVTFAHKSAHQNHMQNKHSETPQVFACPHCDKTFSVKRFMSTHVKRMHLKVKKYFCDVCGRGFFEKIRMKQHRVVHAPLEEREASKQFVCGECGSRFRDKAKLLQHANIHTGTKPFKCTTCNKCFTWRAELTKHHVSRHTEERPFRCTVCHKAFKFRYKLTSHMITHTRQSRHTCPTCGRAFTQRSTLRKHRCRLPIYEAARASMAQQSFVQIQQGEPATQPEEIYIQLEDTNGGPAVVGSDSLAQIEAASADVEGGSVTFMCGMCQQLFSTAAEINNHVLTEHGESVTLVMEGDDENNQAPEVNVCEVELDVQTDPEEMAAVEQLTTQEHMIDVKHEQTTEIQYVTDSTEAIVIAPHDDPDQQLVVQEEQISEQLIQDSNHIEQSQVIQYEIADGSVMEQGTEVIMTEETVVGMGEQIVTVHMVDGLETQEHLVDETGQQLSVVDETDTEVS